MQTIILRIYIRVVLIRGEKLNSKYPPSLVPFDVKTLHNFFRIFKIILRVGSMSKTI